MGGAPDRVMIDNTHVVVLRGTGSEMIAVPEMEAFAERFGFRFVAHETGRCQSLGARGAAVPVHRKQLSCRTHVHRLAGSEPAGAPVVRPRQLDLQEAYPRRAARTVRGRAHASEAAAGLDSGSLPAASTHGGCRRLRLAALRSATRCRSPGSAGAWKCAKRSDKIEIELDARHIVTHARVRDAGEACASRWPSTGRRAAKGIKRSDPHPEEQAILEAAPEIAAYVAALKQKGRKVPALALRQLLRLLRDIRASRFWPPWPKPPGMDFTIWTASNA